MLRCLFLIASTITLSLAVAGCDVSQERADAGYKDGFAVGYNTACQIRATLIEGDFKNPDYAGGYARGQTDGIIDCNKERSAKRIK
jgi:hypothetical protein